MQNTTPPPTARVPTLSEDVVAVPYVVPRTILPQQPTAAYIPPSTDPFPRHKRTRAKRSCDSCRKKKSRCDADDHRPCSNCVQIGGKCTFLEQRKKRGQTSSG
ncbi:hypothetical protein BC936DRAFT_141782 [Jimgerdemannia flammicorona]|uniref:Zn(2)-C6 fungal-type domain-containing protein n=1 Tax=Jimgerdemannia flammicorona TaxID=994334 RepID=A0A433DMP9_9FUNG|nr:hypothetical protein BC936DRAFT_141782 [Jimgerdemannia flammicorona]